MVHFPFPALLIDQVFNVFAVSFETSQNAYKKIMKFPSSKLWNRAQTVSIVWLFVFQVGEKDKAATGDGSKLGVSEKRKAEDGEPNKDLKKVGVAALLTRSGKRTQYE